MDNKREEYHDERTNEEFYGEYYDNFINAKRKVVYVFEDITVERPSWKDFKHLLKITLDDENISYDEFVNGPQQGSMHRLAMRVLWFFSNADADDVYMIYKNNEYAGFFCLLPPTYKTKLIATEMNIRNKFHKTFVFVAAADAIINKLYPNDDLALEGGNEKRWRKYTLSMDLDVVEFQVFKKTSKKIINDIIQKRLKRGTRK